MRVPFYIKLFIAFVIFAILLLGFTYFAFNNFNNLYTEKKEKDNIENILKYQEDSFKEYVKSFDEKMFLLTLKDFIKIEDKQKQLEVFKKFLFVDETILEFSLISLDAQEIFKVTNSSGNLKIIDNEKLQNIYSNSYYKNIRTLKEEEIWHDLDNDFRRLIHLIKAEEYVPDSAIVEYAVLHDLIEKSGSFYSFTDDGAIVAKLFINASLPKIVEPEKE